MLIWKGWGILVPVIYLLITTAVREGLSTAGMEGNLAVAVGIVLSAIVVWFVGRKLNNPAKGQRVIDAETGEQLLLLGTHSLFWIKIEYWAVIVPVVLGAIVISQH